MSLSVTIKPIEERFRARLEEAFADARAVLEGQPDRVLAVAVTVDGTEGSSRAARAQLEAAVQTNPDAPGLPIIQVLIEPSHQTEPSPPPAAPELASNLTGPSSLTIEPDVLNELVNSGTAKRLPSVLLDDTIRTPSAAWERADKVLSTAWQRAYSRAQSIVGHLITYKGLRAPTAYTEGSVGKLLRLDFPATASQAIATAEQWLPALAREVADDVTAYLNVLVADENMRSAVLARDSLVGAWSFPYHYTSLASNPGWAALWLLQEATGAVRNGEKWESAEPWSAQWNEQQTMPPDVAYTDALDWACAQLDEALKKKNIGALPEVVAPKANWEPIKVPCSDGKTRSLWPYQLGTIFRTWREVDRDRQRPALAIDAGKANHALLMGLTRASSAGTLDYQRDQDGYVELIFPDQHQIMLGLPGEAHERLISEIKKLRSPIGLRSYATLLHLLSVRGQRQGFVRWTLEEHLDVQGVPHKERREERRRQEANEVELLTRIELAVRDAPNGRVRERRPLFIVGSRFERLQGSKWRLDGMELTANPLIWRNVRDPDTGKLGSNYGLGTAELPRLNLRKHTAALALGLILPIRFRMALNDGLDHHDMFGETVLQYAGLKYSARDPNRTWAELGADLDELVRIGGIRRWEWRGGEKPSRRSVLRFYMAEAHRDRMAFGVRPLELPAARPLTGTELKAWRTAGGLTQAQAAAALGVSTRGIRAAEAGGDKPLGPSIRDALRHVIGTGRAA